MHHEMLTQHALFCHRAMRQYKKGHTESAFHDACRTSSGTDRVNGSDTPLALVVITHIPILHRIEGRKRRCRLEVQHTQQCQVRWL